MRFFRFFPKRSASQHTDDSVAASQPDGHSFTEPTRDPSPSVSLAVELMQRYRTEQGISVPSEQVERARQELIVSDMIHQTIYRHYLDKVREPDANVSHLAKEAVALLTEAMKQSAGDHDGKRADYWLWREEKTRQELESRWSEMNSLARLAREIQSWDPESKSRASELIQTIRTSDDAEKRNDALKALTELAKWKSPIPMPPGITRPSHADSIRSDFLAAIQKGDLQEVSAILEHFPDFVRFRPISPLDGHQLGSPLFLLASCPIENRVEVAEVLIARGADVRELNPDLGTPLDIAAMDGDVELARLLIAHGAYIDAHGVLASTPLCLAASQGKLQMIRLLVERGANVNVLHGRPLRWASRNGEIEAVKLLLELGADSSLRDPNEGSALDQAIEHNQGRLADVLRASLGSTS